MFIRICIWNFNAAAPISNNARICEHNSFVLNCSSHQGQPAGEVSVLLSYRLNANWPEFKLNYRDLLIRGMGLLYWNNSAIQFKVVIPNS